MVVVEMDDPSGSANKTNDRFKIELNALLHAIETGPRPRGLIFVSAKRSFGVGGDIGQVLSYAGQGTASSARDSDVVKALFRRIELLGCPSVAVIEGTAAGGGWELALACHARFCRDDAAIRLGFPEVDFGLVPGAGGTLRLVHLLGPAKAAELITGARMQEPRDALAEGLLAGLGTDRGDLIGQANAWIAAHPDAVQPWDRPGHLVAHEAVPETPAGGVPGSQAARRALAAIREIAALPFARGSRVESLCFAECATSSEARALIGLGFYDRNVLRRNAEAVPDPSPEAPFATTLKAALESEIAALASEGVPAEEIGRALATAGYAPDIWSAAVADGGEGREAYRLRLLFAQATSALRLLDGRSFSAAAANVASVAGGFPRRTGGVLRFIAGMGPAAFLAKARDLAARHGPRFAQPFEDQDGLSRCLAAAREHDSEQGKQA